MLLAVGERLALAEVDEVGIVPRIHQNQANVYRH
jgi:hypothetical protein